MTSPRAGNLSQARKKMNSAEARQRMMEVAAVFLRKDGLTVGLNHLSYEQVIHDAEVPRSAAYRLWKKKEDFYGELLREVAGHKWKMANLSDDERDAVIEATRQYADRLDSPDDRMKALINAVRTGFQYEFARRINSIEWQTYVSLCAAIMSLPSGDLKSMLLAELQQSEADQTSRIASFYADLTTQVGFRIKPGFDGDYGVIASVIESIVEGFAIRSLGTPHVQDRVYHLNALGFQDDSGWTMPAFVLVSTLKQMIEVDPDWEANSEILEQVDVLLESNSHLRASPDASDMKVSLQNADTDISRLPLGTGVRASSGAH